MSPRKNSSKPPGKLKMGQKSSKKKKAAESSNLIRQPKSTSSSSVDASSDLERRNKYAGATSSKATHNRSPREDDNIPFPYRIANFSSKNDHNCDSSGTSVELSGLLTQLSLHSSLKNVEAVRTPDQSENSPILQSFSGISSIAPALVESHVTGDESPGSESCEGALSESTGENSSEELSDGTSGSRSTASILPVKTTILTRQEEPLHQNSVGLSKPPGISFYIPRQNIIPKTKDAAKQSLTPFQRINQVAKSKLFSNIIAEDSVWKLKKLQHVWDSINLTDIGQWGALKSLGQPVLMNLKLVESRHSYGLVVASVSDFKSCSALFEILGEITLSKFEYHKSEVMMEVVTPKFMNILQRVVDEFHTHRPIVSELTRFIENLVDIYGEIFLQLDSLATDGLAADLAEVVESCLELFRNEEEKSYCAKHLEQLLLITESRGSLIRANSCFPYDILSEESVESNIIDGPFDSFDQYLSIHYRLLKEDFQNSLREGMLQYMKTLMGRGRRTINYHLTIYPRVTLVCNLTQYVVKYKILFHDPAVIQRLQDPATRSFLTGALLILTPRISSSNPEPFKYYYLVRVEDSSPLEREKTYIYVSMILGPPNFIDSMELLMAEPSQLFEPYYRVLNMIRSLDSNNFPFIRYIVDVKTDVSPPAYMTPSTKLRIGSSNCLLWDDETWPNPEDIELNRVQLEGLKLALRSELAIIQGPPGTGKTYLSRKIVEVLLQNKKLWHKNDDDGAGLILVVCFKNQSLDQLLTGLIKAGKKVLRVGTQSKEETLDEYNLKTLHYPMHSRIYYKMRAKLGQEQEDLMDELTDSIEAVRRIENQQGLIKLHVLSKFLHLSKRNLNYLKSHFEEWLIDLPFPKPDFNKVEHILLESKSWEENSYEEEDSMFDFYHISLQDLNNKLYSLNSRMDVVKELGATDNVHDLTCAVAYLVKKLAFMEDALQEMNRPITHEVHMKMMHLKLSFESTENQSPIEELPLTKRWLLYRAWVNDLYEFYSNEVRSLIRKSRDCNLRLIELRDLIDVRRIAYCDADVIGMTTTAAAKYHKIMACLKPKIVLVEEAAEVVEAHTVASLSEHCEHLILVGDHKQLRPLTSSYIIGKEAHLDISMYERLVRNGFPHCTLNTQYRMRPEISSLIAPAVYPNLIDDPSVSELPHVLGVSVDLYFVDHSVREDKTPDIVSRWNRYEAEFHLALCLYLVRQGYEPNQITVLATYSEQEKYFNKEKLNYPELEDVLMATVDSFQGKENDIILLSLVRSNEAGNIGFLAQKNRINVALSRAKRGLYITGNSQNLLAKGGLWHEVVDVLSRSNAIGNSLPLKCQIHGKLTRVTTPADVRALKNGGCLTKCHVKLACGHNCIHRCHPMDRKHQDIFKCSNLCTKLMGCSHSCIRTCHYDSEMIRCFCKSCSPNTKCETKLSCGHTCKSMAHEEDPEHKAKFRCNEVCDTKLKCGHICSSLCHFEDVDHKERYKCPISCEGKLFCGHPCRKKKSHKKHVCSDHKTACANICSGVMPCGHVCFRVCHNEDLGHESVFKCLQCGAKSLIKTAKSLAVTPVSKSNDFEKSSSKECLHGVLITYSCDKVCGFQLKCGHQCNKKCHSVAGYHKQVVCKEKCGAVLTCGHACYLTCHMSSPSLHKSTDLCLTCNEDKMEMCSHCLTSSCANICGFEYKCGHSCAKKCGHHSDPTHNKSCVLQCGFKYKCGHSCIKKCGHPSDPLHSKSCVRQCVDKMGCGHPCNQRCHFGKPHLSFLCKMCEKKDKLSQLVQKTSSIVTDQTCKNDCNPASSPTKQCDFKYECGHRCAKKFQHSVDAAHIKCCKRLCGQLLDCGHRCNSFCHCKNSVLHSDLSRCKACKKMYKLLSKPVLETGTSEVSKTLTSKYNPARCAHGLSLSFRCKKKCGFKYKCGHKCLKKCRHGTDSAHIKKCRKLCDQPLACGHPCKSSCHLKAASDQHAASHPCATCKKTICPIYLHCGHQCSRKRHDQDSIHECSACPV